MLLRRPRHGLLVPLLLALLLTDPGVAGDADVAALLFKKAEKASRAKKYDEAVSLYERALAEHSPYPEASYGLAVALDKQGDSAGALKAYVGCREAIAGLPSPSAKIRSMGKRVDKAIRRLGAGYAELEDIDRRFVRKLISLGKRYIRSNPPWAKRAFETVLAIDPDNAVARSNLEKLSGVAAPADPGRPFTALITDDRMKNWAAATKKLWSCAGGVLTADASDLKGHVNTLRSRLEGTYSFRATFRTVEARGPKRTHGLFFGEKLDKSVWALLIDWNDEMVLLRYRLEGRPVEHRLKMLTSFDATKWHTIQVDVTPGKVVCRLDAKVAFELGGQEADAFDGPPSLFIQNQRIEIKDAGARR